jgi:metal-responsive CopG/Arc/MetJ family transcriptional regulator
MKKQYTGIGLDQNVLKEVDKQRREMALKEGRDVSRSAFINNMLQQTFTEINKVG